MGHSTAADIATINRISAVPAILQVITEMTGMRFAAVARVTQQTWTACAVLDNLGKGAAGAAVQNLRLMAGALAPAL